MISNPNIINATMIGAKLSLAWIAARGRDRLSGRVYRGVMVVIALVLGGYAIVLARNGLRLLL